MKALALCVALTIAMLASACAGLAARENGTAVIADAYATVVRPIALVGIGAEQDAGRITEARAAELREYLATLGDLLDNGDLTQGATMRTAWNALRPVADAQIDRRVADGEIGPGVGAALKETVRLLGERILQLTERAP